MAYISTKEVAAIRGQLKEKFKGLKFSVRKHHHSSVTVTIKAGNVDFSDLLDDNGYAQTNQYWLNRMGKHEHLFEEIYKVIKTAPASVEGVREWFDDSDAMSDYFHTAFSKIGMGIANDGAFSDAVHRVDDLFNLFGKYIKPARNIHVFGASD